MPSTYSPELRLTLQADGENPSTWGDIANTVFQLIEQAVAGMQSITLSSGDTTLTTNNGASDQARAAILNFTGALSGNCKILIPNVTKTYIVYNNTTLAFTVSIQTADPATGSVVTVTQGTATVVFCDGNNNVIAPSQNATSLGGVAAANYAQLTSGFTNLWQSAQNVKEVTQAFSAGIALNLSQGNIFYTTLTGGTTLNTPTSLPGAGYDQPFLYFLTQDATGGRTVGFNSSWLFTSGVAPTVDQTPGSTTVLSCIYSATIGKVLVLQAYYGYNGAVVVGNVTITQNTINAQIYQQVGSPVAAVNVTVTVNPGVRVIASDPQSYAMDFSGFASGSVITLVNNGYILGRGGNGGVGGSEGASGATKTDMSSGNRGRNGGSAINGPGSGSTLNITNPGFIWGGGGGGGGGGSNNPGSGQDSNGGGGGGGAGGSLGGDGGQSGVTGSNVQGNNGGDGTWVTSGANGAGGTGTGATPGNSGGNGGDWGANGTAGTNGNTAGGAAGTAGKAVNKNSATVNFTSGGSAPNVKGAVS